MRLKEADGQKQAQQQIRVAVPMGGLNSISSIFSTPETDALILENFVVRPYGLEIRKGWRYWYDDPLPAAVVSLFSYIGSDPASNQLFASTAEAFGPVYDVTTPAAAPPGAAVLTPGSAPDTPGEWHSIMFVTSGGHFLCAVQAGAGYFTYNGAAWTTVATGGGPGQVSFPDATTVQDIAYITVWKERLWFIKRNSTNAYYLPVGQITGATALYNFGPLFKRGGNLQLLMNWTYDGGSGMDDSLLVLSDQGDLLIYQGTDPASVDTFSLKGVWYVGIVPPGRRNFALQGGDVWIITEYGVVSISDLVSGRVTTPTSQAENVGKYNPTLAQNVTDTVDQDYWFMAPIPGEEILYVGSPFVNPLYGYRVSYMMNSLTKAWSSTFNLDPYCSHVFNRQFIFGDRDGYIKLGFFGHRDGDNFDSSTTGDEVTAKLASGFFDCGSPTSNKTATRVRLLGLADGVPEYFISVKSEYDIINVTTGSPAPATTGSLWDVGLWDVAVWQFAFNTFKRWFGVSAFGKKLSIQLAIRGSGYVLITDYEVTFKKGNGL